MEIAHRSPESFRARLHVPSLSSLQASRPTLVAAVVVWALLLRRASVELF